MKYGLPQAAEEVASGYCFDACPGSTDSAGAECIIRRREQATAHFNAAGDNGMIEKLHRHSMSSP